MKFIDLSLEIAPNNSEPVPVEIEYISHAHGADILGKPINIGSEQFPEGLGLSLEHVKLTTHTGTHIDAPLHYGPICEGKQAKNISEIPLDWFFQDGVVLNCQGDVEDGPIAEEEIKRKLDEIEYKIKPFDIILLNTGADKWWGEYKYFTHFRGVTKEATKWLVEQGVKVIGIDSFGFDQPFPEMLKNYQQNKNINALWPSHFYGREKEYCQIERLANLKLITKPFGFKICCFPIKLLNCGAGWSRVVAIMESHLS